MGIETARSADSGVISMGPSGIAGDGVWTRARASRRTLDALPGLSRCCALPLECLPPVSLSGPLPLPHQPRPLITAQAPPSLAPVSARLGRSLWTPGGSQSPLSACPDLPHTSQVGSASCSSRTVCLATAWIPSCSPSLKHHLGQCKFAER